jgi:hypothetical protein
VSGGILERNCNGYCIESVVLDRIGDRVCGMAGNNEHIEEEGRWWP